jgi:hypothetical protein
MVEKTTYDIVAEHVRVDTLQNIAVKGREQLVQAYTIKNIE